MFTILNPNDLKNDANFSIPISFALFKMLLLILFYKIFFPLYYNLSCLFAIEDFILFVFIN